MLAEELRGLVDHTITGAVAGRARIGAR